jgi:uncharacterized lipoprotein
MKKILKRLLLVLSALAVMALAGCDDGKGPMQTAGEKTDNAVETAGDAVKGAAKTTGNAVKVGAEKTGDAVENTVK